MKVSVIMFCLTIIFLLSCNDSNDPIDSLDICPPDELLEVFINSDGREIFIYENGELYSNTDGTCTFEIQYFDPSFLADNYTTNTEGTFLTTDNEELFPTKSNYIEDFETASTFNDLFVTSLSQLDLYWTNFTLQSPATPSVTEYVELSQCILNGNCDFIDNKMELITDPADITNTAIKFTCVPPSDNMEISKCSMISTLNFFQKSSEVWFEAKYYIESGVPFSLVDFENTYFEQSPGPRVVIRNNKLELENKFGSKFNYDNNSETTVPQNEWFKLKVHLKYSNNNDGIIELWQNGSVVISETGINLPTSNSIQNKLEIGVTASTIGCELLMDDIRISETPF